MKILLELKNPIDSKTITEEEIKSPLSESLLSVLPIIDPESYDKFEADLKNVDTDWFAEQKHEPKVVPISSEFDKLDELISDINVADTEIKKRVLGYTQWFSDPPVSKDRLYQLLESEKYGADKIENNAQRLKQENLLIETENYWLTNTKNDMAVEVSEQAMAVVMPEILALLEDD